MTKFKIQISASAKKSLIKIPKKDLVKLIELIQTLAIQPYPPGTRKITGEENTYRVRQGRYRVIYEVDGKKLLILIFKIGNRKDIYKL